MAPSSEGKNSHDVWQMAFIKQKGLNARRRDSFEKSTRLDWRERDAFSGRLMRQPIAIKHRAGNVFLRLGSLHFT